MQIRKYIYVAIWILGLIGLIFSLSAFPDSSLEPASVTPEQQNKEDLSKDFVRLGNSSVWLPKNGYDEINGTLYYLWVKLSGPISNEDVLAFKKLLAPYLDKNYLKKNPKPRWYKAEPYKTGFAVSIDSEGGDVYAAMEIGRMFRKARASEQVTGRCLSSCVFLLAGAVQRYPFPSNVGIHRPYSLDTTPTSLEDLQARTARLGDEVSSYLRQMNIPESFYDEMKLIPPEKIKILSSEELDKFGLSHDDPVFSELFDNQQANVAGVSKSEFLSRKELARKCIEDGALKIIRNGQLDALEYQKLEGACTGKIIYKGVKPGTEIPMQ